MKTLNVPAILSIVWKVCNVGLYQNQKSESERVFIAKYACA